jgi:TolB-like protein
LGNVATLFTPHPNNRKKTASSPRQTVKIHLYGLMKITDRTGKSILPSSKRARAVLAILCLARGERVARSTFATLLWERSDENHAQMNVRKALSDLGQYFGAHVPGLIEIDRDAARLNLELCWIDVFEDTQRFDSVLQDLDGISLPLDQWLRDQRVQFEDARRDVLETELQRLIDENAAPEKRAAAARALVNFERTHEGAVRALMVAFAEMGDRGQAVREFERCRAELKARMDLTPSAATIAVYEAVRLAAVRSRTGKIGNVSGEGEPRRRAAADSQRSVTPAQRYHASIAVLPFQNLSPETLQDYTPEGLVEDLTEILSRVPNVFVIARSTTSAFRGENRSAAEIGSLLGVRYVLYGSMRVYGDHLRLTAELTDASTGDVIWRSSVSEHFFDLVEIQTRLADAVVRCVAPHLYRAEYNRVRSKRAEPLGAHDLLLRAQENMNNSSRVVFETSERLFDEAINLDPGYASALAWRAYWHVLRVAQGWSLDPAYDVKQADRFSQQAVDADELDPMALAIHGHVAAYLRKDFDTAFRRFDAALRLNPNAAPAWLWSAAAYAWIGDGHRAVEEANQAVTLSPFDPLMCAYSAVAGMAYLADAQYDRALECGLRSMGENRRYSAAYKLVILAHTLSGRKEAALPYIDPLLTVEPGFSVERYRRVFPGSETSTGKLYADALATAGVPLNSKPRARLLGPV